MNTFLKVILIPFSGLYQLVTAIRNYLYDKGILKSSRFDLPIIGVGNLRVGGTGKTPMVEYLIEILCEKTTVATLSRGYGRITRGFRIVNNEDSAKSVGDEPLQVFNKYGDSIVVSVGEERILAVPKLLYEHPEIKTIILDDAYQHRALSPSLQIMLTEYGNPFYHDMLMPSGRLRESRKGAGRADIIIVTKCPADLGQIEKERIMNRVKSYSGEKPIYFTYLDYGEAVAINKSLKRIDEKIILVTGIANPKPLIKYIQKHYQLLEHFRFSDHHTYKASDVEKIITYTKQQGEDVVIVTTEKDAVKLKNYFGPLEIPVYSLPVKVKFIEEENSFKEKIFDLIDTKED